MRAVKVIHLSPRWEPASLTLRCPFPECQFVRTFGTLKGIRNGLVAHMLQGHDVQIIFDVAETKLTDIRDRERRRA